MILSGQGDWCQLWSIKTGHYYFNKRTGKCQQDRPAGFIPLPDREIIQAAPSEDPIPEVEEAAERAEEKVVESPNNESQQQVGPSEMRQVSQPTGIQKTTDREHVPTQDADTTHEATNSNTEADNTEQLTQRVTDSGIDDNSM